MSDLDIAEVRAALQARAVLESYGWKFKRAGDELESAACPSRSDHSRRAFVINANSGRWQCFPCATSGDLLDFIAAMEGLAIRSDFGAVLTKAAEIAGVGPSTLNADERKRRNEEWQAKARATEAAERAERQRRDEAAVPTATAYWGNLASSHARGFDYLCERRVEGVILTGVVRFDAKHGGSPALALFSRDGEIRNVVSRRVPELGEPKTPGLYQCPSAGTLVNSVHQIETGSDVVVTEGVMDSITARLAWPLAVVLGAHGAGNLPKIVAVAMPAIIRTGARMSLVPHHDHRGCDVALDAGRMALEAGLSVARGTLRIVKHGHKDLNDAWQAGWRAA